MVSQMGMVSQKYQIVDQMKEKYNTGGKQPLHLCKYCVLLNIQPPTTNTPTKFTEKSAQEKTAKKQKRDNVAAIGLKETS